MTLSVQQMVDQVKLAAEDKKAYEIKILDIRNISVICDYFIICNGHSKTQVKAIAESIEEKLSQSSVEPLHREGWREGNWVLLDYGDVVVHIFGEKDREFYNLERLWGDAEVVPDAEEE